MPKVEEEAPKHLRPYEFHGVRVEASGGEQAVGDCPFCGKERKFSINVSTGLWSCKSCQAGTDKGGGNLATFLRLLWKTSDAATNGQHVKLAEERKLLHPETLMFWEVTWSDLSQCWLVPGYGVDKKLNQLYKYQMDLRSKKMVLFATPGVGHQLHGVNLWDPKKPDVFVCEGPWDAMVLWETMRATKETEDGFEPTASEASSLLAKANVVAVPGCGSVGEPFAKFLPMFAGKRVALMFDSDHPREAGGKIVEGAGWTAMRRVAGLFHASRSKPKSVEYLHWGEAGYDPDQKSGHDVRDVLSQGRTGADRSALLGGLLAKVGPIPTEWVAGRSKVAVGRGSVEVEPESCDSWSQLTNAWRKAMSWRPIMSDVLAVMLAVALSTEQKGDQQLFLQVIGDAGSGKTRFCDAMLVSKRCFSLEHMTGFHSGWKDASGEDFSLLSRINRKTLITPEGDVLMSSPNFTEIMSQQRRIFDGSSGASYKNRKEDLQYTGLRTPWIIAGTPALLDMNQAKLGDRFLKIILDQPTDEEKGSILTRVGFASLRSVVQNSDGGDGAILGREMLEAYRMTGGYVDWLRSNASELLSSLVNDEDRLVAKCASLAEFASFLRARPSAQNFHDKTKDNHDTKEMPTRLLYQFVRLACCLAAVLGKRGVDEDVERILTKMAVDTAKGGTLGLCKLLFKAGRNGMSLHAIAQLTNYTEEKERLLLRFMRRIGAVEVFQQRPKKPKKGRPSVVACKRPRWRLTERLMTLYREVVGDAK